LRIVSTAAVDSDVAVKGQAARPPSRPYPSGPLTDDSISSRGNQSPREGHTARPPGPVFDGNSSSRGTQREGRAARLPGSGKQGRDRSAKPASTGAAANTAAKPVVLTVPRSKPRLLSSAGSRDSKGGQLSATTAGVTAPSNTAGSPEINAKS
jgi:hypothetical protein